MEISGKFTDYFVPARLAEDEPNDLRKSPRLPCRCLNLYLIIFLTHYYARGFALNSTQ